MPWLYSALLAFTLFLLLPYWLWQMARSGKYRAGLSERFGRVPARLRPTAAGENCIWIHAVSVGEVLAIAGLVEGLRKRFPGWRVVVSTTTLAGQALARKSFGEGDVFYLPLDLPFALRRYLRHLSPRMLVLAETEFWPNLLFETKRQGARIAVVNARISDRSLPRYRYFRRLLREPLAQVNLFLAQSAQDKARLLAIGAAAERTQVSGNLKFDISAAKESALVAELRAAVTSGAPVLVCGSTVAGEEEILIAAFQAIQRDYPAAVMVLAPRHPERFDAVAELLSASAISFRRRSRWLKDPIPGGVFLLDTIGELAALYALADVAFVGGSLAPRGGHNILEPARFGKAIVVGPHTENFRDIITLFARVQALCQLTEAQINEAELSATLLQLFHDPGRRAALGAAAEKVFRENAGATARTLDALEVLVWMPGNLPVAATQPRGEARR